MCVCVALQHAFSPLNNVPGRVTSIYTYAILSWNCCAVFCCMEGLCLLNQPTPDGRSGCFRFCCQKWGWKESARTGFPGHCGVCPVQGTDSRPLSSVTLLRDTSRGNEQPRNHWRPRGPRPPELYPKVHVRASACADHPGRGSITSPGLRVSKGP